MTLTQTNHNIARAAQSTPRGYRHGYCVWSLNRKGMNTPGKQEEIF